MKKILPIALLLAMPIMALAITENPAGIKAPDAFVDVGGLWTFIQTALNWFFVAIVIVAVFYLLWVGLKYVTSGGKADVLKTAGSAFTMILLGLAIAIIAKGLVYAVCQLVGNTSCKLFP